MNRTYGRWLKRENQGLLSFAVSDPGLLREQELRRAREEWQRGAEERRRVRQIHQDRNRVDRMKWDYPGYNIAGGRYVPITPAHVVFLDKSDIGPFLPNQDMRQGWEYLKFLESDHNKELEAIDPKGRMLVVVRANSVVRGFEHMVFLGPLTREARKELAKKDREIAKGLKKIQKAAATPAKHVPAFLDHETDPELRVEVGGKKWYLSVHGKSRATCGACGKHRKVHAMSRNVPFNCYRCLICFTSEVESAKKETQCSLSATNTHASAPAAGSSSRGRTKATRTSGSPAATLPTSSTGRRKAASNAASNSPTPPTKPSSKRSKTKATSPATTIPTDDEPRDDADRAAAGEVPWDEGEYREPERFSAADLGIPEEALHASISCGAIAEQKPARGMFELFGERYVVTSQHGSHEFRLTKASPIEEWTGPKYTYTEKASTRERGSLWYRGMIITYKRKQYVLHGGESAITIFCPPLTEGV